MSSVQNANVGKQYLLFNFQGESKAICCLTCKKDDMVDVRNPKCSECLYTYGNPKYDGYCTWCFQHLFPTDARTLQIRSKSKEIAVKAYINKYFEGFMHDKPIQYGCDCSHRRRIDHRILEGNTMLAIETDEDQHKYYDKKDEENRYNDLVVAFGGKFIFIRFNPDKYKDVDGCVKNPRIATRLTNLHAEIDKQLLRIKNNENRETLEVVYLYYDET